MRLFNCIKKCFKNDAGEKKSLTVKLTEEELMRMGYESLVDITKVKGFSFYTNETNKELPVKLLLDDAQRY